MADDLKRIALFPWVGGTAQFGHAATKRSSGLKKAENWVFDFDGTKHRRGGQRRFHRIPIREGLALEDHFLGPEIQEKWTVTEGTVEFDLSRPSILRGSDDGAADSDGSLVTSLEDDDGNPLVRDLVETLDSDLVVQLSETTELLIAFRLKLDDAPATGTGVKGFFEIDVDPGTPSGNGVHWHLRIRFAEAGIFFWDGAVFDEVEDLAGVSNIFSVTSSNFINTSWHNWLLRLTRSGGSVFASLSIEEEPIYSNIPIPIVAASDGEVSIIWSPNGTADPIDVSIDHLDVDAEAQRLRGLHPFRTASESPVRVGRSLVYAGSRVYVEQGDYYNLRVIDEGLSRGETADFKIFLGEAYYATTAGGRIRKFNVSQRKGEEVSGSPNTSILQVHANRLWAAGDLFNRSRVYWSGFLSAGTWNTGGAGGSDFTDAGFIDLDPDDGERVTAISPGFHGDLIVYKENSIHRIRGTSPIAFSREILSTTLGCVSHQAVANVLNDQYFVSRYGIHSLLTTERFGDLESAFASKDIRDEWEETVNTQRLHLTWARNNEVLDRFEVFVPIFLAGFDGQTLNRMFSLHYGVRTEEFPDGIWSWKTIEGSSLAMLQPTGMERPKLFAGSNDGFIVLQDFPPAIDFPAFGVGG